MNTKTKDQEVVKYTYGILRENTQLAALHQLDTFLPCKHKKTKYGIIEKALMPDGSEIIVRVIYGSNLEQLTDTLKKYVSWYNEPLCLKKDMQQNISEY